MTVVWRNLSCGVQHLRAKCFFIGYLNLLASTVDLGCHLVILSAVTNFFSCDVDLTILHSINWSWLEPFLVIINIGTHGFYPFPLVLNYYDTLGVSGPPRCYPGMLHMYLIDLINILIHMVWLKLVMSYITALYKNILVAHINIPAMGKGYTYWLQLKDYRPRFKVYTIINKLLSYLSEAPTQTPGPYTFHKLNVPYSGCLESKLKVHKDADTMRMFFSLSVLKVILQMLYFAYTPIHVTLHSETLFNAYWLVKIVDICVAISFLLVMNSYIKAVRAEKAEKTATETAQPDQPPSYVECLMHAKEPEVVVAHEGKSETLA